MLLYADIQHILQTLDRFVDEYKRHNLELEKIEHNKKLDNFDFTEVNRYIQDTIKANKTLDLDIIAKYRENYLKYNKDNSNEL